MANPLQDPSCVKSLVIMFIAVLGTIAAFLSGASALGMIFVVLTFSALGFGAGTIMNSPEPVHKK
jgi:hypothetical protein